MTAKAGFDAVVFAGGGCRCFWQLGFWSVAAPALPLRPLGYHFKEGSNQWWTAVQVRDHRHAVKTFEVKKGAGWVGVPRLSYNYFVDSAGMGADPYTFRITDVYGQQLVDTGVVFKEAATASGAGQFPACH